MLGISENYSAHLEKYASLKLTNLFRLFIGKYFLKLVCSTKDFDFWKVRKVSRAENQSRRQSFKQIQS